MFEWRAASSFARDKATVVGIVAPSESWCLRSRKDGSKLWAARAPKQDVNDSGRHDMSGHGAMHGVEIAAGAVQELAKRAGQDLGHPHGIGKLGEYAVRGAAAVAPAAVASVAAGTTAVVTTAVSVAIAAAPVAAALGACYGVYRLVKWLDE